MPEDFFQKALHEIVLLDEVRSTCAAQPGFFASSTIHLWKTLHDAKSWPLCCISPEPASSALLHSEWLKRTHEVLNFWNSRNLQWWSHIFKFLYITQFSYKRKLHNPKVSAINLVSGNCFHLNIENLHGSDTALCGHSTATSTFNSSGSTPSFTFKSSVSTLSITLNVVHKI